MAPHTAVLPLLYALTTLSIFHLLAGAAVAGTIAYAWIDNNGNNSGHWTYENSSATLIRGVLIAFWCVIPAFLFLLHAFMLWKGRAAKKAVFVGLGLLGVAAWGTQMALEGICMWGPSRWTSESTDFCPWAYGSNGGTGEINQASGILFAWVLPWLVIPFFPLYACLIFFSLKGGQQKITAASSNSDDLSLMLPPQCVVPRPSRQISQKCGYTNASSRFTDVATSTFSGNATLGPPSYESASRFLKSVDEKSVWSIDEEKAGKF